MEVFRPSFCMELIWKSIFPRDCLEASGAFAFEARVNLKGEDFRIPDESVYY